MWRLWEKLQVTGICLSPSVPNIHFGGLNSCFAQLFGSGKKATPLSCWHTKKINPSTVYLSWNTVFGMKSDLFKLFLMLWFSLQKDTPVWSLPQTSNTPQSPEDWRRETCVFPEDPTPAFVGNRQAEAQASETDIKKNALLLPLSYGMLAEICQWSWELLLGAWGGWILLPCLEAACSISLGQGCQHCTRCCHEQESLPAWHCRTEQGCDFLWLYQ